MSEAKPYPKGAQLARGERRYRRKVAGPSEWAAINVAKMIGQTCRLHEYGPCQGVLERHHIVSRSRHGDDVADNIAPLCGLHHEMVTRHLGAARATFAASLTDAERAYVVGKLGEAGMERLFGVGPS